MNPRRRPLARWTDLAEAITTSRTGSVGDHARAHHSHSPNVSTLVCLCFVVASLSARLAGDLSSSPSSKAVGVAQPPDEAAERHPQIVTTGLRRKERDLLGPIHDGGGVLMTIRVLLADEHVMLRQSLRAVLDTQPNVSVVGEADNSRDALDLVANLQPNVVLLDLAMPGLDGIKATQRIHDEHPEVRIVILVGAADEVAVVSEVRAGAAGILSTTDSIEVLLETIRAAARGQVTFSAAMSAVLAQELRAPAEPPERLTEREFDVLECVAHGLANKEIARSLHISEKTVKSHVSTILGKLGLESRTQAALHATRTGLVSVEPTGYSSSHGVRECSSVISLDSRRPRLPLLVARS
jgi:DNA-binding NarL/FixJ family response regulator